MAETRAFEVRVTMATSRIVKILRELGGAPCDHWDRISAVIEEAVEDGKYAERERCKKVLDSLMR